MRWWKALVFGVLLAMAGCAATPPAATPQRTDQEVVAEKSQARWKALVAGDFNAAYEFISPAGRLVMSQEAYSGSLKRGFWKDARVKEVKCASPEACEVHLEIEYEYSGRVARTPFSERWVKQDGKWWFLLER